MIDGSIVIVETDSDNRIGKPVIGVYKNNSLVFQGILKQNRELSHILFCLGQTHTRITDHHLSDYSHLFPNDFNELDWPNVPTLCQNERT